MAFAVHQWWRGHHMVAIGFITFAWLMAGVAIEAAKNNQNAEATEVFSAAIADQLRCPLLTQSEHASGSTERLIITVSELRAANVDYVACVAAVRSLRQLAGGAPTSFLKARLNAASDS